MQNLNNFEKMDVKALDNAIKAIGDDWMLITVDDVENKKVFDSEVNSSLRNFIKAEC